MWLLTPKAGRDGHVEPSDIGEAAPTAGLSSTKSTSAAKDWSGTRLVAPASVASHSLPTSRTRPSPFPQNDAFTQLHRRLAAFMPALRTKRTPLTE